MNKQTNKQTNEQTNKWTNEQTNEQTNCLNISKSKKCCLRWHALKQKSIYLLPFINAQTAKSASVTDDPTRYVAGARFLFNCCNVFSGCMLFLWHLALNSSQWSTYKQ